MKKSIIIILILFLTLNITTLVNAKHPADKFDCYDLNKNIQKKESFKRLEIPEYMMYNTTKYYEKYSKNEKDFLIVLLNSLDKIYENNNGSYNFKDKIRYYYYRNKITVKYSTEETFNNYKKYLYITYKFREIEKTRPDLKFPYDADMSGYYEKELMKKNNIRLEQDLQHQILEDPKLKADPELQNLF